MSKIKELITAFNGVDVSELSTEQVEQIAQWKKIAEEATLEEQNLIDKHNELQEKYKQAIFGAVANHIDEPFTKDLTDKEIFENAVNKIMGG